MNPVDREKLAQHAASTARTRGDMMTTLERLVDLAMLSLSDNPGASKEQIEATVSDICLACETVPYESYVVRIVTMRLLNRGAL